MGEASGVDSRLSAWGAALACVLAFALTGCGQTPLKPSPSHIRAEQPPPEGAIPAPVQVVPVLPPPSAAPRAETYSVVVNNVRVQDLLFALARDAKLNVDIHPGVQGSVTLNAIDQTLPQILSRISKQVDMRYEIDGSTLSIMRDTPYLRLYRVDYVNLSRDTTNQANLSTQVSGSGGASGGSAGAQNNSTSVVKTTSVNRFWETLVANIKDLLRETDKIVPLTGTTPAAAPAAAPGAAVPGAAPSAPLQQVVVAQPAVEYREAASVIANAEAGVLSIRATSRQHEKVQEFLDQVLASAKRQVLIEATIAEVQLNNQYQRGIDWTRIRAPTGLSLLPTSATAPAGLSTARNTFVVGFFQPGLNITGTLQLLESFGDVRVLSSPKVSVLNNQTAILKVVDNLVYFTVQGTTVPGTAGSAPVTTFTSTVNSVPVGFLMSVVPQISESDTVLLNIRPTISRKVGDVQDPNPSLANPCGTSTGTTCGIQPIASLIPVIQTREMESVMRVQSGQTAVLGGLIQDAVTNNEDTIPGVRSVPGVGQLLAQRKDLNQKTELVIFLRPIVIPRHSLDG